jgi:hypothetical protein
MWIVNAATSTCTRGRRFASALAGCATALAAMTIHMQAQFAMQASWTLNIKDFQAGRPREHQQVDAVARASALSG